jgi:predicted ABC-type ATPase
MPVCWIISGPNGAGKTTFALEYLPSVVGCQQFINADLIAAGLSPLAPERGLVTASRLFLNEIERCIAAKSDFGFETTLAGRGYLRMIRRLQAVGWRVELIYLALPNVGFSRARVAERVVHGGHAISPEDIARRFPRSLHNLLHSYSPAADRTRCFMNRDKRPELIFRETGGQRQVFHHEHYQLLLREARQ